MTVLPELERQLVRAAGAGRATRRLGGPGRVRGWGAVALGCVIAGAVVLVFASLGTRPKHPRPARPASTVHHVSPVGHPPGTTLPVVPATYARACAETGDCLTVPAGSVPTALRRPFRVPALRSGATCPTTSGTAFSNSYLGGVGLGIAPVRPDIANAGDLRHGRIVLGTTDVKGWYAIKTIWFSLPSYDGPWSVRAARLSGTGRIDLGNEPTLPSRGPGAARFSPTALIVPPGATLNTGDGYRTDPRSTWISAPGCYAWLLDGLHFSDVIVFQALPPRPIQ